MSQQPTTPQAPQAKQQAGRLVKNDVSNFHIASIRHYALRHNISAKLSREEMVDQLFAARTIIPISVSKKHDYLKEAVECAFLHAQRIRKRSTPQKQRGEVLATWKRREERRARIARVKEENAKHKALNQATALVETAQTMVALEISEPATSHAVTVALPLPSIVARKSPTIVHEDQSAPSTQVPAEAGGDVSNSLPAPRRNRSRKRCGRGPLSTTQSSGSTSDGQVPPPPSHQNHSLEGVGLGSHSQKKRSRRPTKPANPTTIQELVSSSSPAPPAGSEVVPDLAQSARRKRNRRPRSTSKMATTQASACLNQNANPVGDDLQPSSRKTKNHQRSRPVFTITQPTTA
ncbi:hypothetical protein EIP91_000695 [Steccherinum ochraceum]|uniref:Uncharacterized protein n=1 Tax=Steccherinum ochraceum TaxID=92696 RepID=A0A4R0RHS7_9APHY|nr:hypothetical protein EIP91_000695 [Steccherinum ochraceum]